MNWPIAISVAVIIACILLLWLLFRSRGRGARVSYQTNLVLFSPEERVLFGVLNQAVGDEFAVLGRIPVGEIIQPRRGAPAAALRRAFDELGESVFEFVLCARKDLSVACVVQMLDRGHGAKRAQDHDDGALRSLCEAARLPLVRIPASPFYEVAEIREAVRDAIRDEPFLAPPIDGRKEPRFSSIEGLDLE
ncbi:MAG: DUF2726 domain-containing protein [Methylotetracoccus sp.]